MLKKLGLIWGLCAISVVGCDVENPAEGSRQNFETVVLQKRSNANKVVMSWVAEIYRSRHTVFFTRDGQEPLPNPDQIHGFDVGPIVYGVADRTAPRPSIQACPQEGHELSYNFDILLPSPVPSGKVSHGSISLAVESAFWNLWPDEAALKMAVIQRFQDLKGYHICTSDENGQSCLEIPVERFEVDDVSFECG